MSTINIYKDYLKPTVTYKGGKTMNELDPSMTYHRLASNENLLGSSPLAKEAIKANIEKLNWYPDRTDTRLQDGLSAFYNHELKAGQFITGPSGSEVLELIIRAFMGPDLECIIANPAFLVYQMFSEKMASKVIDIPLNPVDFSVDFDAILNAVNDKTRLIFLTSPNNPTGSYIPKEKIVWFLDQLPDHVITILDEVYFQYATADDYCTAKEFVLQGKNIIGINSFSKAYGLAGLRIGYGYTTPEIAGYVRQLYKPFLVNLLAIEAALAALRDTAFIKATVDLIHREKPKMYTAYESLGIHYWPSQSNFVLIRPDMDIYEFADKMFSHGVMVRPAENFGAPGCVRITIGTAEANDACIHALGKIFA